VVILNVREAKMRDPVSQPFWKKTMPVRLVRPGAAPGDMKEGHLPSNLLPLARHHRNPA